MNEPNATLEQLDRLIEHYHLLKHPFYQAWTEGTLTKESLQLYAEQYFQHVRAFPENLKQLAARTNGKLEQLVEENLAEELDPSSPHPALWKQFAQSLGVEDKSLDGAKPLPGIATLLEAFDDVSARGTLPQAVAAFYCYEAQVPEIATEKISGLRKFYEITTPRALAYFAVHEEADVRHRAAWREWLAEHSENSSEILASAERTLKALWGALDAVYPEGCVAKN